MAAEAVGLLTGQLHSLHDTYLPQLLIGLFFAPFVYLAYRRTRKGSPYRYPFTFRLIGHPVPREHPLKAEPQLSADGDPGV
jgi:uncharacterized Tic20 family protein